MACCLIALMLLAQATATLRRWGAFWGLVPVPAGVEYETAYVRARRWLGRREVRAAVAALVALELGAVGMWLYVDHGAHIRSIADDSWQRMTGHRVIYAGLCEGTSTPGRVRLVLNTDNANLHFFN
jgi:hypothetical protein